MGGGEGEGEGEDVGLGWGLSEVKRDGWHGRVWRKTKKRQKRTRMRG